MGSSTENYRTYNVTATYPDMQHARAGVEVLEERGIEATSIFLSGDAARQAAVDPDTAQRDEEWMSRTGRGVYLGLLAGLLIGLVLGTVVGLLLRSDTVPVVASTIGFGIALALLGAFVGGLRRQKISGAFEDTMDDDTDGDVVVGVHTDDEAAYRKAEDALAGTGPARVDRFDGQGTSLS